MAEPLAPGAELIADAASVAEAMDQLARQVQPLVDAADGELILLTVMNGGMVPAVWLAERLTGRFRMAYCHATRYRETESGRELNWQVAPPAELAGRPVLVIDDILDMGITLARVLEAVAAIGPGSLHSLVLCRKTLNVEPACEADFTGLTVPDRYVFGCGMDYRGYGRGLPGIWALPKEGADV